MQLETHVGPVPTYSAAVLLELHNATLTLSTLLCRLKIGTAVTPTLGKVHPKFGFLYLLVLGLGAHNYRTEQTHLVAYWDDRISTTQAKLSNMMK